MKKKKKSRVNTRQYFANERALEELAGFKHRDLQRACIVRGLESKDVVGFDHHKLVQWFIEHFDNSQDDNLLILHDAWVDAELIAKGYKKGDVLLSPALKFSFIGDLEKMDKPKLIKPQQLIVEEKKPKVKAVIDKVTGVRSGTKKALTYELAMKGNKVEDVIKEVKKQFPLAEEKSIKIWFKRALKA